MSVPEKQTYRFGDVEVDLSRGCLTRDGQERHLRQMAFQVLIFLLERRERLISKKELFESVWKDTAVTDDVLVQCIKEIRRSIGDDPYHPRFIKTVSKSGYRFIGVVEAPSDGSYVAEIAGGEPTTEGKIDSNLTIPKAAPLRSLIPSSIKFIAALLVLVFVIAGVFYFVRRSSSRTQEAGLPLVDGRSTVAVTFFENQSKSTDFDWLREGLADMLSAGLSRSDRLTVLSREQLHTVLERSGTANKNVSIENAKDIATQTHAAFIVSGSFAQIGEAMRLDVRLYDGKTGNLMTTETLTVEKAERLLSEIDLLSLKISNRLNASPQENRDMASVMTNNLEAYRYYSLAVEKSQAFHNAEAVEMLQKAIVLDPEFAMAHARIGYAYAVTSGQTEKGMPYLERAFQLSNRLTEKDRMNITAWYAIAHQDFSVAIETYRQIIQRFPFETEAYWRLARLLTGEENFDEAIEVLHHGLNIDADAKDLYNSLGSVLSGQGKHADAIAAHQRYVTLAPAEPNAYDSLGLSYQWAGEYEKAIENYNRALEMNPKFEIAMVHLANTRFRLGQYREAIAAYNRYIEAAPTNMEKTRGISGIAQIYLQKGDLNSAENYAERVFPSKDQLFWLPYAISVARGDTAKSKRLEKMILSNMFFVDRGTRPNPRFELYDRGMFAFNNGRNDESLEYFRRTIAHPPPTWNYQDLEDCLAEAFLKLGRFDDAIAEYQRILQLNPRYPLAHFHLCEAYRGKGLTNEAQKSCSVFLVEWKDADSDIPEIIAARKFISRL